MAGVTLLPKHRTFLPLESFSAPSAKRQRCSAEDVLRELSGAGLEQPVVASLERLRKRAAEAPGFEAKRLRPEPRPRPFRKAASLPEDSLLQSLQLLSPIGTSAIALAEEPFRLPIPGSLATPLLPPLEFTRADGWAWAELPQCWRDVLSAPWERTVAAVAVDAKGTAYLASPEGQVLAAVPATELARRHAVELQLGEGAPLLDAGQPVLLDLRPSAPFSVLPGVFPGVHA